MNKIKELLEEHSDLCGELMSDKEFVEKSKEIFEENGLEFSEEMLRSILKDLEESLIEVQNLSDEKLSEVVGGASTAEDEGESPAKKERTKGQIVGSIAIKATSTVIGTVLGGATGLFLGSDWKWEKGKGITSAKLKPFPAVIGAGTGNVIGYRVGKLISDKLGYE